MLFNSIDFAVFLPIVFIFYWVLRKRRTQNFFILSASYFFYGWWDWRFLSLIILSTCIDYIVGLNLQSEKSSINRKLWLTLSVFFNIGILVVFKYLNFFLENLAISYSFFGSKLDINTLSIILPVGLSFYTFQTLSYSIDVYNKKLSPTKDFIAFASFVSFFPQLVAGPIERAINLLPQFRKKRIFDSNEAIVGLKQILWGLFKKVVIADNCATIANLTFNSPENFSTLELSVGAIMFSFQIYCDFSGYSDIAIGTAKLFGFKLSTNFKFPYFSKNINEFWQRWHISLSSWFRDYLYIPLGGSKNGNILRVRNVLITFVISGLWHGANWAFIVWGILHALLFIPSIILPSKNRIRGLEYTNSVISILFTFGLVTLCWVFFRADSVSAALNYLNYIIVNDLPSGFTNIRSGIFPETYMIPVTIALLLILEWKNRENLFGLQALTNNKLLNKLIVLFIISSILIISGEPQKFIYFDF